MRSLIEGFLKPLLVAAMAIIVSHCNDGCYPPGGAELEKQYQGELLQCVEKAHTKSESCWCRKAVDEKYGLCDHPEWPKIGRCDFVCEGL
jgi:hypothetical protein